MINKPRNGEVLGTCNTEDDRVKNFIDKYKECVNVDIIREMTGVRKALVTTL